MKKAENSYLERNFEELCSHFPQLKFSKSNLKSISTCFHLRSNFSRKKQTKIILKNFLKPLRTYFSSQKNVQKTKKKSVNQFMYLLNFLIYDFRLRSFIMKITRKLKIFYRVLHSRKMPVIINLIPLPWLNDLRSCNNFKLLISLCMKSNYELCFNTFPFGFFVFFVKCDFNCD